MMHGNMNVKKNISVTGYKCYLYSCYEIFLFLVFFFFVPVLFDCQWALNFLVMCSECVPCVNFCLYEVANIAV